MAEDNMRITDPHKLADLYQFFLKKIEGRLGLPSSANNIIQGDRSTRVVGFVVKDGFYKFNASLVRLSYEMRHFCLITNVVCNQFAIIFDIGFVTDNFEVTGATIIARGDGEDFMKFMLEKNDIT
jgi:hypothetical protein